MKKKVMMRLLALLLTVIMIGSDALPILQYEVQAAATEESATEAAEEASDEETDGADEGEAVVVTDESEAGEATTATASETTETTQAESETTTEEATTTTEVVIGEKGTKTLDSGEYGIATASEEADDDTSGNEEGVTTASETQTNGVIMEDGVVTGYEGDTSVETLTLDSSVTKIASGAFTYDNSPNLKDIYLTSESQVTLYENSFAQPVVVWVADELFSSYETLDRNNYCWHLAPQSATIDESGYIIKDNIFYAYIPSRNQNEDEDTSVVDIPASITEVKSYAIQDYVSKIIFHSEEPPTINGYITGRSDLYGTDLLIQIPDGSYEKYKEVNENYLYAMLWPETTKTTEEGFVVAEQGSILLQGPSDMTELVVPEGITEIGAFAFTESLIESVDYSNAAVTYIGVDAFSSSQLKEIVLPDTVETIAYSAFYDNENVTGKIVLPDSLEYIGDWAFAFCSGDVLPVLSVPDEVEIEEHSFWGTDAEFVVIGKNLPSVQWVSGLDYLEGIALTETDNLNADYLNAVYSSSTALSYVAVTKENEDVYATARTELEDIWPEATYYYYDGGFLTDYQYGDLVFYCGGDEVVTIPEEIEWIEAGTFANTGRGVKELVVPATLYDLSANSLQGLVDLEILTFDGRSVTSYMSYCISEMDTLPSKVVLKDMTGEEFNASVSNLFWYFGDALTIEIQGGTKDEQGFYVLEEDEAVTLLKVESDAETITVPEGVTQIVALAFQNCKNVKKIILPESLQKLGIAPFIFTGAQELQFKGKNIPEYWIDSQEDAAPVSLAEEEETTEIEPEWDFFGTMDQNWILYGVNWKTITVPGAYIYGYKYIFDGYTDVIVSDGNDDELVEYVVSEDGTLLSYTGPGGDITIPSYVKCIPEGVFTGMDHITSVSFEEGVEYIEACAFSGCSTLGGTLKFPNSLKEIGDYALEGTAIEKIQWGNSLEIIGYAAFDDCSKLLSMTAFPETLTSIDSWAFASTSLTGKITLPDSLTYLGEYAFAYSTIKSVEFGNGLTNLSGNEFYYCKNLSTVVMTDAITAAGNGSFYNCTSLEKVVLSSSLTAIPNYMFLGCEGLKEIEIPASVTSIGISSFNGCTSLEKVNLPEGLTSISTSAFESCSSLQEVEIPDSVTSIGNYAYGSCTGLKEVILGEGITTLGQYVFEDCTALDTICFGSSFSSFGQYAMSGCKNITTYIFKGTTIPTFAKSSANDAYYSCFPGSFANSEIKVYVPASKQASYKSWFAKADSARSGSIVAYNILALAGMNRTVMEAEEDGETGIYFSFENPYDITLSKWEVLLGSEVAQTVTDDTTGCFISGGSTSNAYGLKVYASDSDYYTWTSAFPPTVITGEMGNVSSSYEDNVITETQDTLSMNVWFESVVRAEKEIQGTFYYKDTDGNSVAIGTAQPQETTEERKRHYECIWNVESMADGTYEVWFEIEDTKETSETTTITIARESLLPKVEGFVALPQTNGTIALSWNSVENEEEILPEIKGYHIYKTDSTGEETLAATVSDETEWTDDVVISGDSYTYCVCVYDAHGREGERSDSVTAMSLKDMVAPIIVPGVADGTHFKETKNIYFEATDNREVARMRLYVKYPGSDNYVYQHTVKYNYIDMWYSVTEGVSEEFSVKVDAMDIAGNMTTQYYTYYVDYTNPEPVTDVTVTAEKSAALTVEWEPSPSDDVAKYIVSVCDATNSIQKEVEVSAEEDCKVEITELKYGTEFTVSVVAVDVVENQSDAVTATGKTLDNEAAVITLEGFEEGATYHGSVDWKVTSVDDYTDCEIQLQYSTDGELWYNYEAWVTTEFTQIKESTFNFNSYSANEKLYLRVKAVDTEEVETYTPVISVNLDYQGPVMDEDTFTAEYTYPNFSLTFKQSTDEDTKYYEVYYGTKLATFNHDSTKEDKTYTVTTSATNFGSTYTYTIYAYDNFGNKTTLKKTFTAYNYAEPTLANITVANSPRKTSVGGNYNKLTVFISYPDNGAARAEEITEAVYSYTGCDGEAYSYEADRTVSSTGVTVTKELDFDTLSEVTEITLTVKDSAGNTFTTSQDITLVTAKPAQVENFYVNATETAIWLNWAIATEITSVKYNIYRKTGDGEFELLTTISKRSTQSYEDTDVETDTEYSYYIAAVSDMGIEGEQSVTMSGTLVEDTENPKLTVTPETGKTFGKSVQITAKATDNVGVAAIRLYQVVTEDETTTEELLTEVSAGNLTYTFEPEAEGTYSFRIEAEDERGLKAEESRTYTADRTGPAKVTNPTVSVTATTASINWDEVSDSDFSYFLLEKYDAESETYKSHKKITNARGVALYNLTPATEYQYQVVAYDIYGNRGTESDAIIVETAVDDTEPVITAISPSATYFNDDFTVKFTAEDDASIAKMIVQYSLDGGTWTDLYTEEFDGTNRILTMSYTFKAADFEDGKFYARAIAIDGSGNTSDTLATAPYTQYGFDRVAPSAPQNVTAEITNGWINIKWDDNTESDVKGYSVYRSTSEDGTFKTIAKNIQYVNQADKTATPGETYYYKVTASDKWGNESEYSDVVSMTMVEDETLPFVHSIYPGSGSVLTADDEYLNIKVSDNYEVASVVTTYQVNDGAWQELETVTGIGDDESVVSVAIPTTLSHGDTFAVKATAVDVFGNESEATEYSEATYTIDKEAPEIQNLDYVVDGLDVTLTWMCYDEDTSGFYIYRKPSGGSYTRIASVSRNDEGVYSFTDESITVSNTEYYYQVKVLDTAGNYDYATTDSVSITAVVPEYPVAQLNCTTSMQVDTEYIFDATESYTSTGDLTYEIDFGDGTDPVTNPYIIYKYAEAGTYYVTVTVTNDQGYSHTLRKEVIVNEKQLLGTVNVKVKSPSGNALSNIPVYFDMANTTDHILYTNASGIASFTVQAGTYLIGAYADGYLPDQSQAVVAAGVTRTVELVLEEEEIVTGTFEVKRMTLSEITAAGISLSDPANQNMLEISIKIIYGEQEVEASCYAPSGVGTSVSVPTYVVNSSGEKRKLIPRVMSTVDRDKTAVGSGDDDGPDAIVVLDVPAEASCLKEFFDVKLYIINNASSEFHLINNQVTLNVPEGMTLVKTNQSEYSTVSFGSLAGQEQKTISWVLRGDEEGEYNLSADYTAVLEEFDAEVQASFATDEPIHVYGMSNLEMVVQVNSQLLYNTVYFTIGLRNLGPLDINYPAIEIDEDAVMAAALTGVKDTECDVSVLEERVSNAQGFDQVVGGPPDVLAAGEMYSKKYAVYGAASDTDVGSLQDVIVEILEASGRANVTVETVTMDLYSLEDAEDKLNNMLDGYTSHAYNWLLTDTNFMYYTAFEHAEGDFTDEIYEFGQLVFAGNGEAITQTDEEEVIKGYIAEILSTSQVQQNVAEKVDTAYIDIAKKTLSNMKTVLATTQSDADTGIDCMLNDTKNMQKLANALKLKGTNGFLDATVAMAEGLGLTVLKQNLEASFAKEFVTETVSEINSQLGGLSDIIGNVSDIATLYNDSAESLNLLMNLQYSYEESVQLLTSLTQSDDAVIKRVAENQLEKIQEHRISLGTEFTENYLKDKGNDLVSDAVGALKKFIGKKAETKAIGWASALYSVFNTAGGWSEVYDTQEKVVIAGNMSNTFKKVMEQAHEAGDVTTHLHMLRYVIETRFVGERSFLELAKIAVERKYDTEEEQTKELNRVIKVYDDTVENIAKMRDTIFRTEPQPLNVPAAPTATIDYYNLCTNESFDETYEYSFDNETWVKGSGDQISFTPKTYSTTLYIRVASSSESVAGNIRVLALPSIRKFDKYAEVLWYDGTYTVKGLTAGETYQYVLADYDMSSAADSLIWGDSVIASEDGTITFDGAKSSYLMMKLPVSGVKIASAANALKVQEIVDLEVPTANVASGEVTKGTKISLSHSDSNAIIYYTTDGSDPTTSSDYWTPYTDIYVTDTLTIKAFATIPESELYKDSAIMTFTWTVKADESDDDSGESGGSTEDSGNTGGSGGSTEDSGSTGGSGSTGESGGNSGGSGSTGESGDTTGGAGNTQTGGSNSGTDSSDSEDSKTTQAITISKTSYSYTYKKNKSFNLNASAKTALSYKSSNEKVAKVSTSGKVTTKGYGTAIITITAKETDTYKEAVTTVAVTVKPLKMTLKSVSAGKKKLTAKFKKDTKATGYQLQYSTSKKFAKKATKTVKLKKTAASKTIKKLKSGKKYYVRIRAYTKVGGVTVYGSWSKVKNCKVK